MSNAAEKIQFVPRANLKRTLTYRQSFKRAFYFHAGYAGLLFLVGVAAIIYNSTCDCSLKTKVAFGDTTAMFLGLSAFIFFVSRKTYEYSKTKVHMNPESLSIEKPGKTIEFHYKDIKSVELAFIPRIGGWFEVQLNDQTKHKFPVGLERSEYILESIANYNPQLVTLEQIEEYRRTSIIGDHTWARREESSGIWSSRVALFAGLPFVGLAMTTTTKFFLDKPLKSFTEEFVVRGFVFGVISVAIGSVLYLIIENRLVANGRARLLKDPNNVIRDMAYEIKLKNLGIKAHIALFIFAIASLIVWANR
ncbi:hypothetical protein ACLSU7_00640 [Bdellovibrio sp. HCB185ZH]|uniref:hypothetical protein n=1 Tax=Bdellovibrio sp. HCB185ZH TaxID=3394235 RepID=UPI0039A4F050